MLIFIYYALLTAACVLFLKIKFYIWIIGCAYDK